MRQAAARVRAKQPACFSAAADFAARVRWACRSGRQKRGNLSKCVLHMGDLRAAGLRAVGRIDFDHVEARLQRRFVLG